MRFLSPVLIAMVVMVSGGTAANADVELRVSGGISLNKIDYITHPAWIKRDVSGNTGAYGSLRIVGPPGQPLRFESGTDIGTRGGSASLLNSDGTANASVKWNQVSLTIPLLLRFQPEGAGAFFKFGAGLDFLGIDRSLGGAKRAFDRGEPRSFDALLMAGIGTDARLFGARVFLEAEGSIGMMNLESEDSQAALHNRTLRVGLGVVTNTKWLPSKE